MLNPDGQGSSAKISGSQEKINPGLPKAGPAAKQQGGSAQGSGLTHRSRSEPDRRDALEAQGATGRLGEQGPIHQGALQVSRQAAASRPALGGGVGGRRAHVLLGR